MSGLIASIERYPQRAFGIFLAVHLLAWTALPALLYPNLPLDLIEALTYGREWQLGYDKLPPLPWWSVELLRAVWDVYGAGENLRSRIYDGPHEFPPESRDQALALLRDALMPGEK